jgi:fructoselysine-6-P-deglycase FrlB-like protein
VPCAALEAAQFRHGPKEAAGARLGVVALAAQGAPGDLVRRFVEELAEAGSPSVLLDAGDATAPDTVVPGAVVSVGLPPSDDVGAVLPMAVVAQRLAVGLAEAGGVTPGVPLRSEKVTREE